jgi:hypothetical protein
MTTEYKIVQRQNPGELETEVRYLLLTGWKCEGGVHSNSGGHFFQAVSKK